MSSFNFRPFAPNTSPKASDAAKASADAADPIVDTSGGGVDDDLVLAVVVPEGASEGSTFHVTLADRVFEVTTPAGVSPGTTINLIVPAEAGDKPFESLKEVCGGVLQAAQTLSDTYGLAERAHQVDEKYKVTERAAAVGGSVLAKAQNLNEKYDLARRLNSILASLDASFQVQKRAVCAEQYIVAFAREIDAKFAISATSASIVVKVPPELHDKRASLGSSYTLAMCE